MSGLWGASGVETFGAQNLIFLVEEGNAGVVGGCFGFGELAEGHDGEAVTDFSEVGGGSIELDGARAFRAVDDVGFEALSVGHIADENAFVRQKSDEFGQVGSDGQAAFIVHGGIGDGRLVQLGFEKMQEHGWRRGYSRVGLGASP